MTKDKIKEGSLLVTKDKMYGNDVKYIVDNSIPGVAKHLRMLGIDTLFEPTFTQNYVLFLARRDDRIIITQSVKMLNAIEQMKRNLQHKLAKIEEYRSMLTQYCTVTDTKQCLLFQHEVKRMKSLSREQILERLTALQEEIDENPWYEYKILHLKCRGRDEQLMTVVTHFKLRFIEKTIFRRCSNCNGQVIEVDKISVMYEVDQNTFDDNNTFFRCFGCNKIFWGITPTNPTQAESYQKAVDFCKRFSYHDQVN
jgi:uncharacterized protein with PIN domain